MPGTNTKTGSRNTNPYIQRLQNYSNENPERFLQQKNDPSQLMRIVESAANRDASSQQYYAEQNQQASFSRQREMAAASAARDEASKQNDFNRQIEARDKEANRSGGSFSGYEDGLYVYRPQIKGSPYMPRVEYQQTLNPKVAMMREEAELQRRSAQEESGRQMAQADRDRYNQELLNQQRQTSERIQQAAQLAAQERLARISQETSIVAGNPGESGWRWF
ncbi:MAG: hypothetical protein KME52_11855 [Desmonostoc geniculatum HA4340-LM1]|jgi:hypothetical protein|nr:hypothetical protein [Desmonostoc geniculatum HA4340-LM1]